MKRILITGAGSYVGTCVERYLSEYNRQQGSELYGTDTLSLRDEDWEQYNFSSYDTVFHVAGIAHADVGNVPEEKKELYYKVNCDLTLMAAVKAKEQGVRQFVYMSSVIIYGENAPVGSGKHITRDTAPDPCNFYGDSKKQAEDGLIRLQTDHFQVAILRAPMIYGKDCKGNYPVLSGIAEKLPVCPAIVNARSILYVENLAEFVRRLVDSGKGGIFFPQNREYAVTADLIRMIARAKGRKVRLWRVMNPAVYLLSRLGGRRGALADKAFSSLTVDQELSREDFDGYQIYSLEESIRRTEA